MQQKISQYYHTLRYLQPIQIYGRLWALVKKKLKRIHVASVPGSLSGRLQPKFPFLHHDPWNHRGALQQGRFCFLRESTDLKRPVGWSAGDRSLLWQFNLHYFHYLPLLDSEDQIEFCHEWIQANPTGCTVGWHPYPTALRIVNWCKANLQNPTVQRSLYQQAAFLFRNLEVYHPGNHLLENAKALIFAGTFFRRQGEAEQWLRRGWQLMMRETPIQVLEDGGYFERSTMYHALMLEAYLDILNILPSELPGREKFESAARKMSDFLASLVHPDGSLALFNDSTQEIAPPPQTLLKYALDLLKHPATKKHTFSDSGFFRHETDSLYWIVDGGPVGPDFLPAHAHADTFSYEVSFHGVRFVVDSGVYEYKPGPMRDYVRSTRAHNTVCVDRLDQAECWSSFRVARRFRPYDVTFYESEEDCRFEGSFSGYATLLEDGIVHHRQVLGHSHPRKLAIHDSIHGRGIHLVESMIHLHPEVQIRPQADGLRLERSGVVAHLEIEKGEYHLETGWHCPEFGERLENRVIVIGCEQSLPLNLIYTFHY